MSALVRLKIQDKNYKESPNSGILNPLLDCLPNENQDVENAQRLRNLAEVVDEWNRINQVFQINGYLGYVLFKKKLGESWTPIFFLIEIQEVAKIKLGVDSKCALKEGVQLKLEDAS